MRIQNVKTASIFFSKLWMVIHVCISGLRIEVENSVFRRKCYFLFMENAHSPAQQRTCLGEASLWTTTWEARGDLRAAENCTLAVLAAEEFSQVIRGCG